MSKEKWARCCAKKCLKPSRTLGRHDVNRIDLRVGAKRVFQDRKRQWWGMLREKHHIELASALWLAFLLALGLSIIGVFATDGGWRIASILVLVCMGLLWFWHLFIEIPAEIFKTMKDRCEASTLKLKQGFEADMLTIKEDSQGLVKLRDIQRDNPQGRLEILVKRITLFHSAKEEAYYADVELYVLNGNVFDLDYSFNLKETELTVAHVSLGTLKNVPTLQNMGADRLGACSLSNVTTIRQALSGLIASQLYKHKEAIYIEWKFNVILSVRFDGNKRDCRFSPQWGGVHDTITEV